MAAAEVPAERGAAGEVVPIGDESAWALKRGARSARGESRRAALVAAAEEVFRQSSYDDVRVADIATAAGTSHGTFYKYFSSKESIFEELVLHLQEEILGRRNSEWVDDRPATLIEKIEAGNRRFLAAFKRYANIMVAIDYATSLNAPLRELQREFRRGFVDRIERSISRWRDEGLIDDNIDPHYAAQALGGMVSRFAYVSHVFGEPFDEDRAVEQLTLLWANSLGLREHEKPARSRRGALRPRSQKGGI